jgi:hypothetical protein
MNETLRRAKYRTAPVIVFCMAMAALFDSKWLVPWFPSGDTGGFGFSLVGLVMAAAIGGVNWHFRRRLQGYAVQCAKCGIELSSKEAKAETKTFALVDTRNENDYEFAGEVTIAVPVCKPKCPMDSMGTETKT